MKRFIFGVSVILILLTSPLTITAQTGKKLYTDKQCNICHGVTGKEKIAGMPRLHGQQKVYLVNQMTDIINGKRTNNYSALMKMNYTLGTPKKGTLEKKLTKKEIEALADFLSKLK